MLDYEVKVPESDELGPGSDLVISMFAMAMLALAFIGSESLTTHSDAVVDEVAGLRLQNAALTKEVQRLGSLPENSLVTLRDSAGTSFFSQASATIKPGTRELLLGALRTKADLVKSKEFNEIIVEGYTSPEPYRSRDGIDVNDRLAFDRAAAIAHLIVEAGVPPRCIGLMSFGRSRSELLYGAEGVLAGRGSQADLARFDATYRAEESPMSESQLAAERRIEIRAVMDRQFSFCSSAELAAKLRAAR